MQVVNHDSDSISEQQRRLTAICDTPASFCFYTRLNFDVYGVLSDFAQEHNRLFPWHQISPLKLHLLIPVGDFPKFEIQKLAFFENLPLESWKEIFHRESAKTTISPEGIIRITGCSAIVRGNVEGRLMDSIRSAQTSLSDASYFLTQLLHNEIPTRPPTAVSLAMEEVVSARSVISKELIVSMPKSSPKDVPKEIRTVTSSIQTRKRSDSSTSSSSSSSVSSQSSSSSPSSVESAAASKHAATSNSRAAPVILAKKTAKKTDNSNSNSNVTKSPLKSLDKPVSMPKPIGDLPVTSTAPVTSTMSIVSSSDDHKQKEVSLPPSPKRLVPTGPSVALALSAMILLQDQPTTTTEEGKKEEKDDEAASVVGNKPHNVVESRIALAGQAATTTAIAKKANKKKKKINYRDSESSSSSEGKTQKRRQPVATSALQGLFSDKKTIQTQKQRQKDDVDDDGESHSLSSSSDDDDVKPAGWRKTASSKMRAADDGKATAAEVTVTKRKLEETQHGGSKSGDKKRGRL